MLASSGQPRLDDPSFLIHPSIAWGRKRNGTWCRH